MQGEGSNSFPIDFNGQLGSHHHNVVPNALVHDEHASMIPWKGEPGLSTVLDTQNHVGFSQFLGDDCWLSPLGDQANHSIFNPFVQNNSNGNVIGSEHGPVDPLLFPGQEAGSGPLYHNLDLNVVVHEGSGNNTRQGNGPYLSLDLFRTGSSTTPTTTTTVDGDHIQAYSCSSSPDPVMIYSGIAEYVVEENIISTDGQRRLLCKRKAPQFAVADDSSSSSVRQVEDSDQSVTLPQNNLINNLNAANNPFPNSGVTNSYRVTTEDRQVQVDNIQRNTHLRTSANRSNLWTWNSNVQPTIGQHPFSTLSSSAPRPMLVNPREAASRQEENPMIHLANMQSNLNLGNQNANFNGNVASSSTIESDSGTHLPYSSITSPHPEPWRLGNYCPLIHSGACPIVRDIDVPMRGGIINPQVPPPRMGPRQGGHHSGVSPTLLSQIRRRRLVFEVRNAFRPGGLRLEDVMVIDRSFLYDLPEEHDTLEDMRLDVDSMSYEELLELEEQIGNVCTGISEEAILGNLRRRKYQSITIRPPLETEPCCICQEEYSDGEELGKLDCGHDFHFNCIKEWLVYKNSCPICKNTALAI